MKHFLALIALLLVVGCSSSTSPNSAKLALSDSLRVADSLHIADSLKATIFPDDGNVSYSRNVAPLLTASCTKCHGEANPAGDIRLTSWLWTRDNRVTLAGDTTSPLVLVVYHLTPHSGQFSINANQQNGIKEWVREGASDN